MFILTDSMKGLLSELASAGHAMEITLDADRLHVTVDYGEPAKRKTRNASASRPAPKEPSKPRFGKKPGRKAKAKAKAKYKYKVVGGKRLRLYAFNGETLTLGEWAKKYDTNIHTMASRFRISGTPETTHRTAKSDRTSLKAKLAEAEPANQAEEPAQ